MRKLETFLHGTACIENRFVISRAKDATELSAGIVKSVRSILLVGDMYRVSNQVPGPFHVFQHADLVTFVGADAVLVRLTSADELIVPDDIMGL